MRSLQALIHADEVGLAYGDAGGALWRSTLRPIYRREGARLVLAAATSGVAAFINGAEQDATGIVDPEVADALCLALALRNLDHLDPATLELHLPIRRHGELDLLHDPHDGEGERPPVLLVLAASMLGECELDIAALRRSGKLALTIDAPDEYLPEIIDDARPDLVGIEANWFRRLAAEPATARLLPTLVKSLGAGGNRPVLIDGIIDDAGLDLAIAAGADLFQGSHLCGARMLGEALSDSPDIVVPAQRTAQPLQRSRPIDQPR